jgi:DNA-binding winged helix-turn-helix (wHTH) protein/TolB-like protein
LSGIFLADFLPWPAMSASVKARYRFGECELDPDERRLLARGVAVTLTPKVFDTLVLLVRNAGHVVSKDELMHVLWPRGFVDESNLTKHVWLIRKALGGDGSPWIETVPKLGYRFVAPVERIEPMPEAPAADAGRGTPLQPGDLSVAPAPAPAEAAIRPETPARPETALNPAPKRVPAAEARALPGRVRLAIAAVLAGVVILAAWTWRAQALHAPMPAVATAANGSIAIVAFNNLSQNAKDAWLGPALGEMLATDIAASGRLHAVADELVRPARADLPPPLAGGYAPRSLALLQRRLGSDYVLSGSYLVAGSPDAPQVRLDLALQDARTGSTVATLGRDAPVAGLAALVDEAGAELRRRLGIAPASRGEREQVGKAQPPTSEVARRIGFALDALHRQDPARARDELLDAIAQAPDYAPAYSDLAQAWSALGYGAKAAAAAQQAAALARDLPREQQLQIEVQEHATGHAWSSAAASAQALVALRPANPDYRLQLVQVQLAAGNVAEAEASLAALRGSADSASDPRTELAAADIAAARDDATGTVAHARRALALARQRDEAGAVADAQHRLGNALALLGDGGAQPVLRDAIAAYRRSGNPRGEAAARDSLGKSLAAADDVTGSRTEYQRAMAIYQGIGDLRGVDVTYTDLARVLWAAGDRDATEAAARHVIDISRDIGDPSLEAWGAQALAIAASDESAGDGVVDAFRGLIALRKKSANAGGQAWALANLADVLRMRGELAAADASCRRAEALARPLSDPQFSIVALFNCAQVELDRGELPQARRTLGQAAALARSSGDAVTRGNVELTLAQIDMGYRRWDAARPHLQAAVRTYASAQAVTGEADADALLAACEAEAGHADAGEQAAARARDLRRRVTERQEVMVVDIALARREAAGGQPARAAAALRELAADARQRHWMSWALESRLALVQVLARSHDPAAPGERDALAREARAAGFGWVSLRLRQGRPTG